MFSSYKNTIEKLSILFFTVFILNIVKSQTVYLSSSDINNCTQLFFYQNVLGDFEDDFNSFNSSKWQKYYPYNCPNCRTHGPEGQIYLDRNVSVVNGKVILKAKKENYTFMNESRSWTSGMIHSKEKFGWGIYEARIKIPKGTGFWPAFWIYGGNAAGNEADEIDIFEFGGNDLFKYNLALHDTRASYLGGDNHFSKRKNLLYSMEGWHTFRLKWEPLKLEFYVDNWLLFTYYKYEKIRYNWFGFRTTTPVKSCSELTPGYYVHNKTFPEYDGSVIINLAIASNSLGGGFTPPPNNSTPTPAFMEIDYFRFYKGCPSGDLDCFPKDSWFNNLNKENITMNQEVGKEHIEFLLSPKIANEFISIKFRDALNSNSKNQLLKIELINSLGRTIKYFFVTSTNELNDNIAISDLENGVYFCRISGNGINQVQKFVKQ